MIVMKQLENIEKEVGKLEKERDEIFRRMKEYRSAIRGTVIRIYKMCNNKNCECHTTNRKKHGVSYYISSSHQKRTRMLYVPFSMVEEAQGRVDGWKRLNELLEKISEINSEIFILEKGIKRKGGKKNDGKSEKG